MTSPQIKERGENFIPTLPYPTLPYPTLPYPTLSYLHFLILPSSAVPCPTPYHTPLRCVIIFFTIMPNMQAGSP